VKHNELKKQKELRKPKEVDTLVPQTKNCIKLLLIESIWMKQILAGRTYGLLSLSKCYNWSLY